MKLHWFGELGRGHADADLCVSLCNPAPGNTPTNNVEGSTTHWGVGLTISYYGLNADYQIHVIHYSYSLFIRHIHTHIQNSCEVLCYKGEGSFIVSVSHFFKWSISS